MVRIDQAASLERVDHKATDSDRAAVGQIDRVDRNLLNGTFLEHSDLVDGRGECA